MQFIIYNQFNSSIYLICAYICIFSFTCSKHKKTDIVFMYVHDNVNNCKALPESFLNR